MSSGRQTLAQQLKELHEKTVPSAEIDPENAYSSLSTFRPNGEDDSIGRSHYAVSGTSRLRDTAATTFAELDEKYAGSSSKPKRVKIFDDDPSDDDEDTEPIAPVRGEFDYLGESSGGEESFAEEDDEDEDDEDGFEEAAVDEEEGDLDEVEEDDMESDSAAEAMSSRSPTVLGKSVGPTSNAVPAKALDPLAALKSSKMKDIEKGQAIQKQQKTFDELLTARITLQKAWASGSKLPPRKRKVDAMETEDVREKCLECLNSLGQLSDRLLSLRQVVSLTADKRRKTTNGKAASEYGQSTYWQRIANESFEFLDRSHDTLSNTLDKWSTKIQAAAAQQANLGKANTKFTNTAQIGVLEAIESGLGGRERGADIWQDEDPAYKALLREVIESRSGSSAGAGISAVQSEKKKRRDAERGASKGRKLRYTVHEKAQNFVVPIPLSNGWHQEQVDELFSSLLGGAGIEGAGADREDGLVMGVVSGTGLDADSRENTEVSLSGLKVF